MAIYRLAAFAFALSFASVCFAGDLLTLKVIAATQFIYPGHSEPMLDIRIDEDSSRLFAKWTSRHIGEKINCLIDGRAVSQPRLMEAITGGSLQIGGMSADEIKTLIPKLLEGRSVFAVEDQK
jgi:preprotein translocase subunit SecD